MKRMTRRAAITAAATTLCCSLLAWGAPGQDGGNGQAGRSIWGAWANVPTAYAASASPISMDTIRVALLLDNGKLKSSETLSTFTSAEGFTVTSMSTAVGAGTSAAAAPAVNWPASLSAGTLLRAGLDQYPVLLLDTPDASQAAGLRDALKGQSKPVSVISRSRSGHIVYQVMTGPYPTADAALAGLAGLRSIPAIAAAAPNARVIGPERLLAGSYPTENEAAARLAALAQAGIDADVAVIASGSGAFSYEVWAGSEASADSLASLQAQLIQAFPGQSFTPADRKRTYILKRGDVSRAPDLSASMPLLLVAPDSTALRVTSKQGGRITVQEKAGHSYRGLMEVSGYKGKLALINELPFEQYLYSVVTGEMGTGWPAEALKAQAVAARTYALYAGSKYDIAQVSDTTLDQAYSGSEAADVVKAVDATQGEVLVDASGQPINALFSSNAGGMTSSGEDVWGSKQPYFKVVPSPDDGAAQNKAIWRQVVLADGVTDGYVHSMYLKPTGAKNPAGLPYYTATEDGVNMRSAPYVDNAKNPPIAKLQKGEQVVAIGESQESNAYSWERGPYTPSDLQKMIASVLPNALTGPLQSLTVSERGASGRATEIKANGQTIAVSSPDSYRSVFGGLPSTRFEIEQSGRYTIVGANGAVTVSGGTGTLQAASGGGRTAAVKADSFYMMSGDGTVRQASPVEQYRFVGTGYGHGVGLSQWGARGLTALGYDYKGILNYYYQNVTIVKNGRDR